MLSEKGLAVKEQLEHLNQAKRRLRNLQNELESWQAMEGMLKAASLDEHADGGEAVSYAERRVIRMQEVEELISKGIDEAIAYEDKFIHDIQSLDILSQNLLMERYLTGKTLKKIIRDFNYSERQIYRKYDAAFEQLAENLKDVSKCQ